jgi:hypothetical protein
MVDSAQNLPRRAYRQRAISGMALQMGMKPQRRKCGASSSDLRHRV